MIALLVALLLDCKPVELRPFTANGNGKRGLTLEVKKTGVTLYEGRAALWSSGQGAFAVMFAADDSWVALKGPYPSGSIVIAPTARGAKPVAVDPLEHLTAEERARIPVTSCGAAWFKGWRNAVKALELTVDQGDAPPLTLHVSPAGAVSR